MANLSLDDIEALDDPAQKKQAQLQYSRRMAENMATMAQTLNESRAAFTNVQASALMQSALSAIPFYAGTTSLRAWMQDVESYDERITDQALKRLFLQGVISRLTGKAKESLDGRSFDNLAALRTHLQNRFARKRNLSYYNDLISTAYMKQNESVLNFHDRLSSIVRAAAKLKNEGIQDANTRALNLALLESLATEYFIRGLPSVIRSQMSNHAPENFEEALQDALEAEEWVDIGTPNRADVEYHAPRRSQQRSRSPSPYGRPETPDREYSQQNHHSVRFTDIHDPKNFDRNIPYHYDRQDTRLPRTMTYTADGKLNAHPSLRYNNPPGILKTSEPYGRPASPRSQYQDYYGRSNEHSYQRPENLKPQYSYGPKQGSSPPSQTPFPNFQPQPTPFFPPPYYYPPIPMSPYQMPFHNPAAYNYPQHAYQQPRFSRPGSPGPSSTPSATAASASRSPTPTRPSTSAPSGENLNWKAARQDGAPAGYRSRQESPERHSIKTFKAQEYCASQAWKKTPRSQ